MKQFYKCVLALGLAATLGGCAPYNYYPPVSVTPAAPASNSMHYGFPSAPASSSMGYGSSPHSPVSVTSSPTHYSPPPAPASNSMGYGSSPHPSTVVVTNSSGANSMHYGNPPASTAVVVTNSSSANSMHYGNTPAPTAVAVAQRQTPAQTKIVTSTPATKGVVAVSKPDNTTPVSVKTVTPNGN